MKSPGPPLSDEELICDARGYHRAREASTTAYCIVCGLRGTMEWAAKNLLLEVKANER